MSSAKEARTEEASAKEVREEAGKPPRKRAAPEDALPRTDKGAAKLGSASLGLVLRRMVSRQRLLQPDVSALEI